MTHREIARRTLLARTGLGLSGVVAAGSRLARAEAKSGPGDEVWSQDYWANKGGVKLALYRKRRGKSGDRPDQPLSVLFLVHGSSLSAQSSFDLSVPDSEYSMMNVFARSGFDVWTMDHENYGRSSQTSSNSLRVRAATRLARTKRFGPWEPSRTTQLCKPSRACFAWKNWTAMFVRQPC